MTVDMCDTAAWNALGQATAPDFFGTGEWFNLTCRALGMEPVYAVVSNGDSPVLGVALARKRRMGRTLLLTPCFATYVGTVTQSGLSEQHTLDALTALAERLESEASYIHLILPPELPDARAFLWRGWRSSVRYTYRVDLTATKESDLRRNVRRSLKAARSAGLEARIVSGDKAAHVATNTVLAATGRGRRQFPVPKEPASTYFDALARLSAVETVAVFRGTEPLACIVQGYDESKVVHLQSGLTEEGERLGAGALAMWEACRFAAERVPTADLAGANMPNVAHFKRGFGGVLTPYVAISWAKGGLSRWLAEDAPGLKARLLGKE